MERISATKIDRYLKENLKIYAFVLFSVWVLGRIGAEIFLGNEVGLDTVISGAVGGIIFAGVMFFVEKWKLKNDETGAGD